MQCHADRNLTRPITRIFSAHPLSSAMHPLNRATTVTNESWWKSLGQKYPLNIHTLPTKKTKSHLLSPFYFSSTETNSNMHLLSWTPRWTLLTSKLTIHSPHAPSSPIHLVHWPCPLIFQHLPTLHPPPHIPLYVASASLPSLRSIKIEPYISTPLLRRIFSKSSTTFCATFLFCHSVDTARRWPHINFAPSTNLSKAHYYVIGAILDKGSGPVGVYKCDVKDQVGFNMGSRHFLGCMVQENSMDASNSGAFDI
jgi:hypothetical protein